MAQTVGNPKTVSVKISTDGKTWTDITDQVVIGAIYVRDEGSEELTEIAPDNPIYAELLDILNNCP